MDAAQWPQDMGLMKPSSTSMEEMVSSSTTTTCSTRPPPPPQLIERRTRPQKEQALNCRRCNSTNTKFCYYNNYSLSQPRYFCKTCRRYWTEGGSLRNVPVGGGSRKNKRSSNSTAAAATPTSSLSSSSKKLPDLIPPPISTSTQNPKFHEGHDLNLAFPNHHPHLAGEFGDFHSLNTSRCSSASTASAAVSTNGISAMELLRSGMTSRGLSPFVPMPIQEPGGAVYPHGGFGMHDFRSTNLNFPMDGIGCGSGGGYENMQEVQEGGGRVLFPFEDLRQVPPNTSEFEQNRGQGGDSSGFWNGVMGGGAAW